MKLNKFTMFGVLALSVSALLSACGGNQQPTGEKTRVQKVVEEAQTLDRDELYKKAAAELGDKTFNWLATSSRGGKDEVKQGFIDELNRVTNSTSFKMSQINYQTTVDGKIYTILNGEVDSGKASYSAALLQDGYQLQTKGIEKGYVNYVPKEWAAQEGVNKTRDADPFTLQFQYKTWMYKKGMQIDNVWDFTKDKLVIDTMDPANENVNMDWLIQLTDDNNAALLKEAFKDATNSSGWTETDVDAYKDYGENRKYSFFFIDKFIKNAKFYADDGKALDAFKQSSDHAAWIVYSKIQGMAETDAITKADIVIAALGENHEDGAHPTVALKGFGGFMYKHYLMLLPEAPLPWTACAFINYLSTTTKGYSKWASDVGDYPSFGESINVNRTKYGHGTLSDVFNTEKGTYPFTQNDNDPNKFPCLNDPGANWWINTAKAPVETPSYIGRVYSTVAPFIFSKTIGK